MSNLKRVLIMILLFLVGLMCIFIGIDSYKSGEFSAVSFAASIAAGALFIFVPIFTAYIEHKNKRKKGTPLSIKDKIKYIISDFKENVFMIYKVQPDVTDTDRLLSKFRSEYEKGMTSGNINSVVTQGFLRAISLHARRLAKKSISIISSSQRQRYSNLPSVQENVNSKGQFIVKDISEDIKSARLYKNSKGKTIYKKKDNEIAHYTLLEAKNAGKDMITCPNCGAVCTRESLLDGCDYCNTKFTVNDLSERVADYSLRNDPYTHYVKYSGRVGRAANMFIVLAVVLIVLFFTAIAFYVSSDMSKEYGPAIAFVTSILVLIFIGACVYFFSAIITKPIRAFLKFIAAVNYFAKVHFSGLKSKIDLERRLEKKIKKEDPLFSLSVFYNDIQNKLASFTYAENSADINAFTAADANFDGFLDYNSNIIDFNVNEIHMTDYDVSGDYRNAKVDILSDILMYNGKNIKSIKQVLTVNMVKSVSCQTPKLYSPSVMKCQSCGASLALTEGKTCEFCGTSFDYASYDWAIKDISYAKK